MAIGGELYGKFKVPTGATGGTTGRGRSERSAPAALSGMPLRGGIFGSPADSLIRPHFEKFLASDPSGTLSSCSTGQRHHTFRSELFR